MRNPIHSYGNLLTWCGLIVGIIAIICGMVACGAITVILSFYLSYFLSRTDKQLNDEAAKASKETLVSFEPPPLFRTEMNVFGIPCEVCRHLWLNQESCSGIEVFTTINGTHHYFRVSWPTCQPVDSTNAIRIRMICEALRLPLPNFNTETDDSNS